MLDACVLHPMPLCDTLLRLADEGSFRAVWTEPILEELERSLLNRGIAPERAARRQAVLRDAFPEALETQWNRFQQQVPASVDAGDRHVVAAALAAKAQAIITTNLKHFPKDRLVPMGIHPRHPDGFLTECFEGAPEVVLRVVQEQAAALERPPVTVSELLARLEMVVPTFVSRLGNWSIEVNG